MRKRPVFCSRNAVSGIWNATVTLWDERLKHVVPYMINPGDWWLVAPTRTCFHRMSNHVSGTAFPLEPASKQLSKLDIQVPQLGGLVFQLTGHFSKVAIHPRSCPKRAMKLVTSRMALVPARTRTRFGATSSVNLRPRALLPSWCWMAYELARG